MTPFEARVVTELAGIKRELKRIADVASASLKAENPMGHRLNQIGQKLASSEKEDQK